jgi:osmotically-inducible protein OsmY
MKRLIALAPALVLALSMLAGCATQPSCSKPECAKDATITADVQARFADYPVLQPPNNVRVRTVDGVVYLSGVVDTEFERRLAESVAAQAAGSPRIVNTISVNNISR